MCSSLFRPATRAFSVYAPVASAVARAASACKLSGSLLRIASIAGRELVDEYTEVESGEKTDRAQGAAIPD
jgi:hypothetical protein